MEQQRKLAMREAWIRAEAENAALQASLAEAEVISHAPARLLGCNRKANFHTRVGALEL